MARTIEALKVCAGKIRRRGVTHVRAVATEACRRAANCEAFLDNVRRETGIELEIISQNEEAALAVCGCAPLIDPDIPDILLFDKIGRASCRERVGQSCSSRWAAYHLKKNQYAGQVAARRLKPVDTSN